MLVPTRLLGLSDIKQIDDKKINPYAEEAQVRAKELCQKAGIYLPYIDTYNTMSPFLYPDASLERLVALIFIMNFLYYVDESYERHARQETDRQEDLYLRGVFENCAQIMLTGTMPNDSHPLYAACLVAHKVISPLSNVTWFRQFLRFILEHLLSTTHTLDDVATTNNDPVDAYMVLRELDCGMHPTMRLIEFANNFYLPDVVRTHPDIQRMEGATASIAGLANDIFSYENEVLQYNSRFNLVAILEDNRGLSFTEAVHEAVKIVNQYTDTFLGKERHLPDFGDRAINQMTAEYVQGLRDQINATWHWQMSTDRYRSPASPFPELRAPAMPIA